MSEEYIGRIEKVTAAEFREEPNDPYEQIKAKLKQKGLKLDDLLLGEGCGVVV